MTEFGKLRADVEQWPTNQDAVDALHHFFDTIDPASHFIPILAGAGLDFTGSDLSGLELAGAELSSARLAKVRMRRTSLYQAWIRQADLQCVDLTGADLRKAIVTGCSARWAILTGARLSDADFTRSDLRDSDIRNTSLGDAVLADVDLRGANLHESDWGICPRNAVTTNARLGNANVVGMRGQVDDPIDVGVEQPKILRGEELQKWFSDHGAPKVVVAE
ncbi:MULTISPECIES: pentapeptide repeat-containing protein [unclassified Rhodococcus (in: high G+C Gram-positive bacteria)]|uniref:pentapeptide repeat-containing protein n=1 Tax=unclassified Rhodococcus (in: high G+C Gram-positive bacteria) TaxID=192944 RepID=UPI00339762D3